MDKLRVIILHNIISPYKTLLFNALEQALGGSLKVKGDVGSKTT